MRRRVGLAFAIYGILTVGVIGAWWHASQPAHRITYLRCKQIEPGMTQSEVEAFIGALPGDYSTRRDLTTFSPTGRKLGTYTLSWTSDEVSLRVGFDENNKRVLWTSTQKLPDPWWDELRGWLRLE
jgi:hypothetical protein